MSIEEYQTGIEEYAPEDEGAMEVEPIATDETLVGNMVLRVVSIEEVNAAEETNDDSKNTSEPPVTEKAVPSKSEKMAEIAAPTQEWHHGFRKKTANVVSFLDKDEIETDPEKVQESLEKSGFKMPAGSYGIRFEDALAMLLKLPGTKRLLLSEKTRDDAVKILIEELNK